MTEPTALSVVLAVVMTAALVGATVVFAIVSQPLAAHRAENLGESREHYLRRQRVWAVVSVVAAVIVVALATWYNLEFRPLVDAAAEATAQAGGAA